MLVAVLVFGLGSEELKYMRVIIDFRSVGFCWLTFRIVVVHFA